MPIIAKKCLPILSLLLLACGACQDLSKVDARALRDRSLQRINQSLNSNDVLVSMRAIEAGVELRLANAPHVCMEATKKSARQLRFAGAMGLLEMPTPASTGHLQQLLSDEDVSVRLAGIAALHRLGRSSSTEELTRALSSQNQEVRANTLTILGRLGEKSATQAIRMRVRKEPVDGIRLQAIEALALLGDKDILSDIQVLANSTDWNERIMAVVMMGLARKQHDFTADLLDKLTDPNELVQLQAARSLGLLGRADGYEVAVKYLKPSVWVRRNIAAERGISPDDPQIDIDINNMRSLAAKALGDIGRWKAAGHLQKMLDDNNPQVALHAAQGSLQLLIKTRIAPVETWTPTSSRY